ncbi:MAG: AsmA family protein [Alphaproteobacteria bacterium]|nr:AsmA family protein [Alphaproteobacteria bacterium]
MKKVIKVILLSILCLFIVVVVGGYIALTQVDFNNYKTLVTKAVEKATGRELKIGNIKAGISAIPVIEVENVTFSNAKWAKEPYMFEAKSVNLSIALLPLLNKNFVINNFKVEGAVVNLEESKENGANWEFNVENTVKANNDWNFEIIKSAQADETEQKSSDIGIVSSMDIRKVLLEDVSINYIKSEKKNAYNVKGLELTKNSDNGINFWFDVNNGEYKGQGVIGALELLDSNNGYPVVAKLSAMGIDADVDLKVYNALGDISFEGKAKVVNFIGKNSGFNESLDISYKGDLKNIVASIRELSIAGNIVKGEVDCNLSNKVPFVKANLKSPKIDISTFEKNKKTAILNSFVKEAKATSLAPNIVIKLDDFYLVNADIEISVNQITDNKNVLVENLVLNALLNNGNANIKIKKANIFDGELLGNIGLNAKNHQLNIGVDVKGLSLFNLLRTVGSNSEVFSVIDGGITDAHIKLNSVGNTYAELVENLDGNVVVIVDKSKLHMGNVGKMKGNIFSQLLNTLNVSKDDDQLSMSCAVIRGDFKDKKVKFPNGIVMNADKFTLVANGSINLINDGLNISIKPFAGKLTETNIAKALSSLVKLTGTIQKPKIGVDSSNAIKTIVGVTTGGPVYLGAQMLLESDGSPCYTALEGTGYESRFPKPKNTITTTGKDVGKILNDSVGSVKDATKEIIHLLSGGLKKNKSDK